ncbi:hypothetical protein V8E55_010079 [Tylopilus felleus]
MQQSVWETDGWKLQSALAIWFPHVLVAVSCCVCGVSHPPSMLTPISFLVFSQYVSCCCMLLCLWCFIFYPCSLPFHCVLTVGGKLLCLWCFSSSIHAHSHFIPCVLTGCCMLLCLWCFIFYPCSLPFHCVLTVGCKWLCLWCFSSSIHAHSHSIPCVLTGCKWLCLWCFSFSIHAHSHSIPCVLTVACKLLCFQCLHYVIYAYYSHFFNIIM